MEIYQLRTLLAVARCGHVTRASEQLNLTQPAVSKQIMALEDELGLQLFDRTPHGVSLTRAGQILLPLAEKTLAAALEITSSASRLTGEVTGVVRLGTIIDPESLGLGDFLARMLNRHPLLEIKLMHGISGRVLEQVQAGELDAGYYLGPVATPGIAACELRVVTYVIVAPPQWGPEIETATWAVLAAMPWVGTHKHSSQHRIVKALFKPHGLEVNIVIEADQESSMINLVKNGVGLCLMREELARPAAARGEMTIWPGVTAPCPLSFIYAERKAVDPLMAAMLDIFAAAPSSP